MRSRLLYLTGQLGGGGSERQLCNLLRAIDRERYRPAVAVWTFSETDRYVQAIRELDVPVYSLSDGLSPVAKLTALRRLVHNLRPEIVHSYSFYTNVAAYWGVKGTDAVPIGSVRGEVHVARRNAGMWLGRLSARWPRDQICNSHAAADACRTGKVFVPGRLTVVRNGLDLARLRCTPLPAGGPALIAGVGSLIPGKRWDRLCRVALELKRGGIECVVQIAGEGRLRGTLEKQARELGVADRIELIGYTNDIPGVLANATCLVHASDSEGCPNVVMEAMACGRAVVAMDVGDVASLVDDGETGFVVGRGDEATLARRIVTLITNQDLCRRMGEAGRRKAERQFGVQRLVAETLAAYRATGWQD